jgi:hypothetical protein
MFNPSPVCDHILFDYPLHHNRQALNVALSDMEQSLRGISTGDFQSAMGWNASGSYLFASYSWMYWRPAWRILQESDAPTEVKDIVREAFILCGDRLAFCRDQERCNGNALSHIPESLRYCYAATGDALQKQLFETYFNRFATEGWGERVGIGRSGDCFEHFAHEQCYGYYIMYNWQAPIADFHDERFQKIWQRIGELYSYLWCRDAFANPWSSRTKYSPAGDSLTSMGFKWKGDGGPDFTTSVNGGDEWFAARRKSYYAVTFHGQLAPMYLNRFFGNTRLGYGGGMLCQLTIPKQGTVIASTLNGDYGEGMEPSNWANFHIHSIVGKLVDGRPLISADSEQLDARLNDRTVSSSGEIRDCPARAERRYTFEDDAIECSAKLSESRYRSLRAHNDSQQKAEARDDVAEAYEMIPFLSPDGKPAKVSLEAEGQAPAELTSEFRPGKTVIIDRGGYGVRIELPHPAPVRRGENNTVLIQLIDKPAPVDQVSVRYRLVPFAAQ